RVAVTRALNQFRREGIITGNPDGGWILRDPHLLAAAAADDPTW
ncbi:MAG: Crp/Fnr family transcriptional regulator, partial [Bacillota bacterium]